NVRIQKVAMTVVDIIKDQDDMAAHTYPVVLWPRLWKAYNDPANRKWQQHRLASSERSHIPSSPGIYTLLIQPGIADHPACSHLMYVGKASSLRKRFGDYLTKEKRKTGRPKIFRLLNKYPNNLWFCFTLIPKKSLVKVEDGLITAYMPPCNDEVPADIRPVR